MRSVTPGRRRSSLPHSAPIPPAASIRPRTVGRWCASGSRQVRVSRSSGVKYLDQVAIESVEGVKKLSPPPPGLVHRELPMAFTLLGTKVKPCPPPPSIDRTSALDETSPVPPTSPSTCNHPL